MSLINEALKKAQRARVEEQAPTAAMPATGGAAPVPRRGKAHSANTMVLFGVGAVILVILSIVGTFYFMKRGSGAAPVAAAPTIKPVADNSGTTPAPPASPSKPVAAAPSAGPVVTTGVAQSAPVVPATPAPVIIAPAPVETTTPVVPAPPTPSPTAVTTAPPATAVPPPAEAAAPPPPPAATTAAAAAQPDPRVGAFVDAIRVTGIRSSGSDSRVLMNERVYRVNDIVDRTLGVRLIKVANDSLTFSDANGVNYVKHF